MKLLQLVGACHHGFLSDGTLRVTDMDLEFTSLDPDPAATALKRSLAEMILWHEHHSPRSQQKRIGPSEIGNPCDRRIAYRVAGTTAVNVWGDPWPAIVGTAIHSWLESAITKYQSETSRHDWLTEIAVQPDPLVRGRSDAFHIPSCTVVDFKTTNADTMRKLRKGEKPAPGYVTQVDVYGLGHENAGRQVKNVALVYYPRSGWLDDAFVWVTQYDRSIALKAIDRLYQIGFQLLDLDIEKHPERFADIPASPGDGCVWCPMFNRDMDPTIKASATGCPGR
jgi:hypothetical protein